MDSVAEQLSTGKRELNAAEKGVVTRLNADVSGYAAATSNINKSQGVVSVAQAALESVADIVSEMKKLATQSADGSTSAGDKDKLQETFASLMSQIDDLVGSAEIDGVNLISAAATDVVTQVGLSATDQFTISAQKTDVTTLGINALDIGSGGDASAAITALETAIGSVSASQSSLSANNVGLESREKTILSLSENLSETVSSIEDANLEQLRLDLEQLKTQKSVDLFLIGVINEQATSVLSIMR
jgi:flagellin